MTGRQVEKSRCRQVKVRNAGKEGMSSALRLVAGADAANSTKGKRPAVPGQADPGSEHAIIHTTNPSENNAGRSVAFRHVLGAAAGAKQKNA